MKNKINHRHNQTGDNAQQDRAADALMRGLFVVPAQLVHVPEAALGGGEGFVHVLEGSGQLCGIAANLHRDARDPSCTYRPSPPVKSINCENPFL